MYILYNKLNPITPTNQGILGEQTNNLTGMNTKVLNGVKYINIGGQWYQQ